MRPKLSVIIPAYNEEAFLPKCLTSLKKQKTSIPFEVIVVDNNSTDKTTDVAKKFDVHLIHEHKPGPAAARNKGAASAKGKILIFLDADCIPKPHHIQHIADWFTKHPHMHVLAGAYIYDSPAFIHWITTYGNFYRWYFALLKSIFGLQILIGGNFAIQKTYLPIFMDLMKNLPTLFIVKMLNLLRVCTNWDTASGLIQLFQFSRRTVDF